LWSAVRGAAEAHLGSLDRLAVDYFEDRKEVMVISRAELVDRLGQEAGLAPSMPPGTSRVQSPCRPTNSSRGDMSGPP
jgi:hypothetical protein